MTNTNLVVNFLTEGNKYCDDCLSETLDIRPRQQINMIVRELAKESSYNREKRQCENCSKDKLVTKKF